MSFIRTNEYRILRRSLALRREFTAFLAVLVGWTVLVNLLCNVVASLLAVPMAAWISAHRSLAVLVFVGGFLLAVWFMAILLAAGLAATLKERRRFPILIPLILSDNSVEVPEVRDYWVVNEFGAQLAVLFAQRREAILAAYRAAVESNKGRPLRGALFQAIVDALAAALVKSLAGRCHDLLSPDADYHGADYAALMDRAAKRSPRVAVAGMTDSCVWLPPGFGMDVRERKPDAYGKVAKEVRIAAPLASVTIGFGSQWPFLSPGYHARSETVLHTLFSEKAKYRSERNPAELPSLWVVEIPFEISTEIRPAMRPWRVLRTKTELAVSLLDELAEDMEQRWSWVAFVDRRPSLPTLPLS